MIAKFCLLAGAAFIVGGAFRIEQGDLVFEASVLTGAAPLAQAGACPDSDAIPYSAGCISFLKGTGDGRASWQAEVMRTPASSPPARPLPSGQACPDNDNVPYSARCIVFLKGATELGMRWRVNADDLQPSALSP
jgi:hypothetical protein